VIARRKTTRESIQEIADVNKVWLPHHRSLFARMKSEIHPHRFEGPGTGFYYNKFKERFTDRHELLAAKS